jgi:hypothetical protein
MIQSFKKFVNCVRVTSRYVHLFDFISIKVKQWSVSYYGFCLSVAQKTAQTAHLPTDAGQFCTRHLTTPTVCAKTLKLIQHVCQQVISKPAVPQYV